MWRYSLQDFLGQWIGEWKEGEGMKDFFLMYISAPIDDSAIYQSSFI
jgi:hypothetical protein